MSRVAYLHIAIECRSPKLHAYGTHSSKMQVALVLVYLADKEYLLIMAMDTHRFEVFCCFRCMCTWPFTVDVSCVTELPVIVAVDSIWRAAVLTSWSCHYRGTYCGRTSSHHNWRSVSSLLPEHEGHV